jgi:predicted alpha/beta superfamily hydrolase
MVTRTAKEVDMTRKLTAAFVFFMLGSSLQASEAIVAKPFEYPYKVMTFDLPVSKNGIAYRLYVRPPLAKPAEGQKFSSIYFLDALKNFTAAAVMSDNYETLGYTPAAYFIGIGYQNEADGIGKESNRTRDYTPTAFTPPNEKHYLAGNPVDYENSGGADAFLVVIEKQIIPFVESRFDVSQSDRVLIGKSMSGLAVVHAVLSKPELFNRYLIISPSIWWDDWLYPRHKRYVMRQAKATKASKAKRETRVYFAVGDDEERMGLVTDIYVLANALRNRHDENLKVYVDVLRGEQHEGIFPAGYMRGIVGLYQDDKITRNYASDVHW